MALPERFWKWAARVAQGPRTPGRPRGYRFDEAPAGEAKREQCSVQPLRGEAGWKPHEEVTPVTLVVPVTLAELRVRLGNATSLTATFSRDEARDTIDQGSARVLRAIQSVNPHHFVASGTTSSSPPGRPSRRERGPPKTADQTPSVAPLRCRLPESMFRLPGMSVQITPQSLIFLVQIICMFWMGISVALQASRGVWVQGGTDLGC